MAGPAVPPKARVLVVEDSHSQRKHLRDLLNQRGFAVEEAAGGVEALRCIKKDPPDVVLLDVVLDDLDGYSVCRWLRLSERTRDVVVIMLTVRSGVADRASVGSRRHRRATPPPGPPPRSPSPTTSLRPASSPRSGLVRPRPSFAGETPSSR